MNFKIVVAIPCYNEAQTIAAVVQDFQKALPEAEVMVFDNNSTDGSKELAKNAGATVVSVHLQGKGYVMREILNMVVADALVVLDGDGTYAAADVAQLITPVREGSADMVVGSRIDPKQRHSFLRLNWIGNKIIAGVINTVFGVRFCDVLSGYRCLSRKFIEEIPLLTTGFETEVEMTIQALEQGMNILEVPVTYGQRPMSSYSKLSPFSDGWRIFVAIAILLRDYYPLRVYGAVGLVFFTLGAIAVYFGRLPEATTLVFLGIFTVSLGFILSAIATRFRESRQLARRRIRRGNGEY